MTNRLMACLATAPFMLACGAAFAGVPVVEPETSSDNGLVLFMLVAAAVLAVNALAKPKADPTETDEE